MDVFISWSGVRSRAVAEALHELLPHFVHPVKPFMSQEDIDKGTRPLNEIERRLKDSPCGIVCVTPENLTSQWLNFEAGAISARAEANVWTYLIKLKHADVTGPLKQFQHTLATKADTLKLIRSLHHRADTGLDKKGVDKAFEANWPELEAKLNAIRNLAAHNCHGFFTIPEAGDTAKTEWLDTKGTVSEPDYDYWLLTKRENDYWPQARIVLDAKGNWEGKVNVDTRPGPRNVTVVLAWTSPEMHSILHCWKEKCRTTNTWGNPLRMKLPANDFVILDSRTVAVTILAPKK